MLVWIGVSEGRKKTKTNIIPERRKGWGWNSGVVVPGEVGILLIHALFLSKQFSKARVACEVSKHNADRKISGYTPRTSAYRALNHWVGVGVGVMGQV